LAKGPEPPPTGENRRRRRDALLLELGALVYELHRRGRRAPELLQKKAGELDALGTDGPEPQAAAGTPCPACGERVGSGQLVCLDCGERLELGRRPTGIVPALAALAAVVVIGAGAFGFALSELTGGSDDPNKDQEVREVPLGRPTQAARNSQPETETQTTPRAQTTPGTAQPPTRSLLLEWPSNLTAHTVVLVTTSDRAAARRVAGDAARSGIEAGLLRSDDYGLGTGLWIVFAGRFDTRRGAARQAANLGGRYPGAYVQLVKPVG
jgi:hypothetical protein